VALESPFRVHVEIEVGESEDDGIEEGRPLRAALLFIFLLVGRGVTPQKLLGETPKAFGECPTVIRL
jgi:hypothetical protein